jgi:hypothetical protein
VETLAAEADTLTHALKHNPGRVSMHKARPRTFPVLHEDVGGKESAL